jgi:hypothetical protein
VRERTGDILKNLLKLSIKAVLLTALIVIPVSGAVLAEDGTIDMVVAPNVINLESNGGSVHVHTDTAGIPADVALYIDGVLVNQIYTFTDSCGNLVVKCSITTVKDIVEVGTDAEFVLTYSRDGVPYTGTDYVPIIQVVPQKP